MPYKVYHEKRDGKSAYCVHKKNPDGSKGDLVNGGCHGSAEEARAQQRALYASENKEIDPFDDAIIEEVVSPEDSTQKDLVYPAPPAGVATSFAHLEAQREYADRVHDMNTLMADFQDLMANIIYTPESVLEEDKVKAISDLFEEFKDRIDGVINGAEYPPEDDKEITDKAKWSASHKNDLPDSAFLYIEPGGKKDESGKTVPRSLRHLPVKNADGSPNAAHIRNAIARSNQVKLSSGKTISPALASRLQARARAMLKRVKKEDGNWLEKLYETIKESIEYKIVPPEPEDSMMVWKEADGEYSWLTSYSNKFIDRDNPPDVIASIAHKDFVDKVDKGVAPLPDLYLWHIPEWKLGYATALAYDDSGFPIAMGRFDDNPEAKEVAEWLSTQKDFGVSHGMWNRTIKRDPDDPSVIIAYETHEISPLPMSRAANALAEWNVNKFEIKELKEEVDMTIPDEKRQELLKRGLPEDTLEALEKRNREKADAATAEGLKSKESENEKPEGTTDTQPVPEDTEKPKENTDSEDEAPVEDTPQDATPESASKNDFPTRQEVADAVSNVVVPALEDLNKQIKDLAQQLEDAQKQLAEVQESDEKRIKEIIAMTPRDSLASMITSRFTDRASSSKQTKVGKNDKLLDNKPREEEAAKEYESRTGIQFIDKMRSDGK